MSARNTRSARLALRRARAFTLVELMVSLVAGVIIAIAVIGLARAATTSFYEQARLTAVEQSVRTAANRLRYDLTRVSFMGTGNIHLATTPGVPYGHQVASQFAVPGNAGARYTNRSNDLQGIRVVVQGSTVDTDVLALGGAPNFMLPDSIEIGGNMTTDDWYIGRWNGPAGGTCGGGTFEARSLADPATERLLGDDASAQANVKNAFTPGPDANRYFARVVDSLGCQHFVEVQGALAANAQGFTLNLCTAADSMSLLPPGTARPGCGAIPNTDETLRISPFHRVRWHIARNTNVMLDPSPTIAPATATFMLFRDFLNSEGNVVLELRQVVAEYAVDLKFGIAVDQRETTPPPNNITVFDLDSDTSGPTGLGDINSWTRRASTSSLTSGPTQPGPQRVRSVKFRVSTRASMPDRNRPLTLIPNSPYISRYCVENLTGCTKFARVRSIVSEVPLINQARMTY